MAKKKRRVSALGDFESGQAWDIGHALRLIRKAPPEEVQWYLPWGGHSPLGDEILGEAREAWESQLRLGEEE